MSDNSMKRSDIFWVPLCGDGSGCAGCGMEAYCNSRNVAPRPETSRDEAAAKNSDKNEYDLKEWMKTIV